MTQPLVCFAHGQESGPWGSKIQRLAAVARDRGFQVESPDYSGQPDPDLRVEQLLGLRLRGKPLVLAGSSMGAYVSSLAATSLRPAGLFLLAPAFGLPGYAQPHPRVRVPRLEIVHGWHDEVVPVDNVIDFGRAHGADLHLLDADHRLLAVLDRIEMLFGLFLDGVVAARG